MFQSDNLLAPLLVGCSLEERLFDMVVCLLALSEDLHYPEVIHDFIGLDCATVFLDLSEALTQ